MEGDSVRARAVVFAGMLVGGSLLVAAWLLSTRPGPAWPAMLGLVLVLVGFVGGSGLLWEIGRVERGPTAFDRLDHAVLRLDRPSGDGRDGLATMDARAERVVRPLLLLVLALAGVGSVATLLGGMTDGQPFRASVFVLFLLLAGGMAIVLLVGQRLRRPLPGWAVGTAGVAVALAPVLAVVLGR